ncbi:Rieske (2Fe-2S) iron-sulfur domain protein [Sulfobacillus acidophilus TPY]|uniref:Rieske (2Fe-2S) iron-sulfur domain protein n=1 Tax=Sulfobacillus acidophilus (strain ATCC 700253 / DSM 10332 / NAL) TaxID=679936 RepID=G8TYC2_SULAD|nr:Rieske (2Fe-2S) iron-sulfur domain protein [Sulfobacillus acidophilus TPY]AEW05086.1 Rieske (2Fe-2S) iron-sulfur domain protein [Sulfobacillus acidophilus DSM 10332]
MAWQPVAQADEIREGQPVLVVVGEDDIALYRVQDEIFATEDLCSHAEASLSEGDQHGYIIECPRHGGRFDIRTGKAKHFPAVSPIRTYPVKIENGTVFIAVD